MALPPLLFLKDVKLTFGSTPLLTGADISVAPGERICLVGRNGSGKSTLLQIAAGIIEADDGERFLQPGTTVRYLPQEPDLSGFATTLAYVEAGLGPGDDPYRAMYLLNSLGLTGEESPANLSGGEARRAALARVLAPEPDVLLLDEPTNHLDLPAIEWLESELASLKSAIVLISHDRRFLEKLSRITIWIDRGKSRRMEEGFASFEGWRDQLLEDEAKEQDRLAKRIEAGEHWMRYGVTARRKRNMRRVAELQDMRAEQKAYRGVQGGVKLALAEGESSGAMVIEAKGISKSFDDKVVVANFSTRIARGNRIGVVGANGAGKTTLLKLLLKELQPDSGTVRHGSSLEIQVLDQRRAVLDPGWTLAEALTDGKGDTVTVGTESRHVIGYMKDFLFAPEQARTPVGVLSGGERARVTLARALAKSSNVLVLDEPTNDLDLETLDVLQELLTDYSGTVLLVSHDRDFLDRVVTSTITTEGDGKWLEYAGGYSDMVAQRKLSQPAEAPKQSTRARSGDPAAPKPAAERQRTKMSFKDKHALETLPGTIEKLEQSLARLRAELDDASLYARDRNRFDKVSAEIQRLEIEHMTAEEDLLRLMILADELGQ